MNANGRPTDYTPDFCELARNYCLLGATGEQLAGFLGVSRRTITNWADSHPEFARALEQGRAAADAVIARALYERAKGYSHQVTRIVLYQGEKQTLTNTVSYPPDTHACMFWLRNRQRHYWSQRCDASAEAVEDIGAALEAATRSLRHAGE
jgi:hypothetical protein